MIALIKGLPGAVKMAAVAALAGMLVLSAWRTYHAIWESGYNAARVEINEYNNSQIDAAVAEARREWEANVAAGEAALVIEENITRNIRDVEKRIRTAIEHVDAGCRDLGDAVLGVLNDATDAANHRNAGTPATP